MTISFEEVSFNYHREDKHLFRRKKSSAANGASWVLKNLNFEGGVGDRFGVIGANGAGKTTLLRLASGIFKPDFGKVALVKPTTSLISSAFGIDVELTGIENIFKKARYMGYTKAEASSKIDEIIDYSGLGLKISNPVRTYSDGMRIRLASSIALKLATGCIIMDEGIAAADLEFTKQVESSMKDFYKQIPMAIIASHSLQFLESSCNRVGYLKNGNFEFVGSPSEAWNLYIKDVYGL